MSGMITVTGSECTLLDNSDESDDNFTVRSDIFTFDRPLAVVREKILGSVPEAVSKVVRGVDTVTELLTTLFTAEMSLNES